jgi:hypothetical protein
MAILVRMRPKAANRSNFMLVKQTGRSQTSVIMKTRPGTFKFIGLAVGMACSVMIFSCAWLSKATNGEGKRHNVVIGRYYIEIPGTEISATDQKQLDTILAKYDGWLYKIQKYNGGVLGKAVGKLEDLNLSETKIAQASQNAKISRLTGWAIQIGDPVFEGVAPAGSHRRGVDGFAVGTHRHGTEGFAVGTHRRVKRETAEKLVKELEPILKQYSKQ